MKWKRILIASAIFIFAAFSLNRFVNYEFKKDKGFLQAEKILRGDPAFVARFTESAKLHPARKVYANRLPPQRSFSEYSFLVDNLKGQVVLVRVRVFDSSGTEHPDYELEFR